MKNHATIITTIFVMGFLSMVFGCGRSQQTNLREGGIYCTQNKDSSYSVLKILKIDEAGVHVRIYSNQFATPPSKVDEGALYMAGKDHKPNETLGIGHLPMSKKSFKNWNVTFIQQSTIKEEELDGYKTWLEAKGGYF